LKKQHFFFQRLNDENLRQLQEIDQLKSERYDESANYDFKLQAAEEKKEELLQEFEKYKFREIKKKNSNQNLKKKKN